MSSSLSAYAQWKLEEEERFYATFPQARCVSYLPPDTYYVDTTNIYCKPDVYTKTLPNLLAGHSAPSTAVVPLSKESVLTSALHYDYLSTNITVTASLQQPHNHVPASPVYNDNFTQPSDAQYNAFSAETQILTASKQLVQPHTIVPSQPRPYDVSIIDHLPIPDSARPEASSSSLPSTSYLITQDPTYQKPSPADQWEDPTPQIDVDSPQYAQPPFIKSETPSSSHDSQQRQQQTHDSESHSPSHHRHHHPHPIRTITPTSNPYPRPSSSGSQSHSLRGIPLTPLPAGSKKPVLRKPPLACHFCRGRKIACGAPDPSNPDRTCNQCERRSLKCEYPLESRRGMRKKKTPPQSTGSTDGGADESAEGATAKSSPSSLLSKSKPVKPGRRPKASPS